MLWDTHMHSQYSGDSDAPQEDMIRAAIRAKLPGICFTDHLDIDYPDNPEAFLLDLPNYTSSVFAMQEQYRDQISVRYGIELGLQPHLAALHADILSQYDFDFVIGSSHVVHGYDPYFPPFWKTHTEEEGYREYFDSILENIRAFDDFDVYGHIDYVVRYGPTRNENYTYARYSDVIDEILRLLIEKGKASRSIPAASNTDWDIRTPARRSSRATVSLAVRSSRSARTPMPRNMSALPLRKCLRF